MKHELTEADLALQRERTELRLQSLGITSLEGAKVIKGADVLVSTGENGEEQLTILDTSLATDRRIIDYLPHEDPPRQVRSRRPRSHYDHLGALIRGDRNWI